MVKAYINNLTIPSYLNLLKKNPPIIENFCIKKVEKKNSPFSFFNSYKVNLIFLNNKKRLYYI